MARTQYLQELESVRRDLIQMGETTAALLTESLSAVSGARPDAAERASELEAKTDHQMRMIHNQCLSLITIQAPVARDARLITGILDAIVDVAAAPGDAVPYVNPMLICRHLERIARHAVCVAEQAAGAAPTRSS